MKLNQNVMMGSNAIKRLFAFTAIGSFAVGLGLYYKAKKDVEHHHKIAERLKK